MPNVSLTIMCRSEFRWWIIKWSENECFRDDNIEVDEWNDQKEQYSEYEMSTREAMSSGVDNIQSK